MSRELIEGYYREVEKLRKFGGSSNESVLEQEFVKLLNSYCRTKNLLLIPKLEYKTDKGTLIYPDGTIKDALRLTWGYLENKDEHDDLNIEIKNKISKGYPTTNIIFQDTKEAVLYQDSREADRTLLSDPEHLDSLIQQFINYERKEIQDFHKAIEQFKVDLPIILETLRELIDKQTKVNINLRKARNELLQLCQTTINPKIVDDDIREMLIQHILTEEIFISIFNDSQFHRENNIAKELEAITNTFFIKEVKKNTLNSIENYYLAIKAAAARIDNHHEKQKFLKILYQNFYKSYNKKAADRLGVFYTPNEIVDFMIRSTEHLLYAQFQKLLSDEDVEILDPATGTGTFITDIIEWIKEDKIRFKYKNEIHCNEIAILAYYIANLNIEYTYKQKTGSYESFDNICFVDTLDNTGFEVKNMKLKLFDIGDENLERIKKQNKRKISVIIGNPPYNSNQLNWNENNKNRVYPVIDKRIRETYVSASRAQKTKMYDMYIRFYRWATDRLNKNGIIAFVTNRSFIDKVNTDGFRAYIEKDFDYAFIIDTQSDVRDNPKISGTKHNVFGIQTGVAIMFLIRKENHSSPCQIHYYSLKDEQSKEDKLEWFSNAKIEEIPFEHIKPDEKHHWLNTTKNDFDSLTPLIDSSGKSIFQFMTLGVSTNRDEWVFSHSKHNLSKKIQFFIDTYNNHLKLVSIDNKNKDIEKRLDYTIKWSNGLKDKLLRKEELKFDSEKIIEMNYRPFISRYYYSEKTMSDRLTKYHYQIFGVKLTDNNNVICFSGIGSSKSFSVLATNKIWSLDFIEKTQGIPLQRFDENNIRIDNVTLWGLHRFQTHYKDKTIRSEDIFYYVYSILHYPKYREKYQKNLAQELPRIPFYDDFWKWSTYGKSLMDIHLNLASIEPYPLKKKKIHNGSRMKMDKKKGVIHLNKETILEKMPKEVLEYRVRDRCIIDWILNQYKESTYNESKLNELDPYVFTEFEKEVVSILSRAITISLESLKILNKM